MPADGGVIMTLRLIPVLMYHHVNPHGGDTVTVTPEVFAGQMKYLQDEGYNCLSADELIGFATGSRSFGEKSVVITFDDGWFDNYLHAVPVLSAYRFKATFFLITSRVDAASLRKRVGGADIPGHEAAKRLIFAGEAERVVLDWGTVRTLAAGELFRFYSHTVSHRRCAELSSVELEQEVLDAKVTMERELGGSCDYLCWPYGSFSAHAVQVAFRAGYRALFTTIDGYCGANSDLAEIKRIEVQNSVEWLKKRLSMPC